MMNTKKQTLAKAFNSAKEITTKTVKGGAATVKRINRAESKFKPRLR